ncbi:lipoyl(octanoyl) transferase LipB [Polymorphobacter arshaanensis]|uniref:Octanoyltransferase n=1 Tax=Glacieibacterium arshaanense TaxID=2511025 RepID=A0A4Y9EQD9_9SPHN|nr:lipoyl(octanoyl) transferase LipB [Polymorphobacter arshaanensis]TFU03579.1 lipoyl(octanoyl) transferase LipB [Polymorphobacter arshaanensis]
MTHSPGIEIDGVEWRVEPGLTDYAAALAFMQVRADDIRAGTARERIWLVEHPPVYTAGTSAKADDLIDPARFPVYVAGRGGQYTYHGPGQRVVYVMLDLERRGRDVRCFVTQLERWIIRVLAKFDVAAKVAPGRVGVWVDTARGEEKVAAIGVRVRRWVTLHGAAINVDPDLTHFGGIVPCGIADHGVTSLRALGQNTAMGDIDAALKATFPSFLAALVS